MYPHRIRLRGPWECTPIGLGAARRVNMPGRWADAGLLGFRGAALFVRKFGYPGKADPDLEHIWLTCDGCTGCRQVRLNGQLLTQNPGDSFAFDVTRILSERNHLEVLIQGDADDAGLWGEVALEIRKDAYLSDVRAEHDGAILCVTGKVIGVAPQPLELYTLVDRMHVDYRTITTDVNGTPFCIELPKFRLSEIVRVELINISEIWYVVETSIQNHENPKDENTK
jgi:hypothetical protein